MCFYTIDVIMCFYTIDVLVCVFLYYRCDYVPVFTVQCVCVYYV